MMPPHGKHRKYEHCERTIEWCFKEAGISKRFWPAERECSHQIRPDQISRQTHVQLAQPWLKKKLMDWQKENFPNGIPERWTTEENQTLGERLELSNESNGTLIFKPQIPIWDRLKGTPCEWQWQYSFAPIWSENSAVQSTSGEEMLCRQGGWRSNRHF